jgi:hypothetical protein
MRAEVQAKTYQEGNKKSNLRHEEMNRSLFLESDFYRSVCISFP